MRVGDNMKRRALVTLPEGVWRVIDELKGTIGDGDSEVIRNIVIAHLSDKGILIPSYNIKASASQTSEEVRMQDFMLTTLVELLDEKGILEYDEWEVKIRNKIQKNHSEEASDHS
jgi:hypothetical protein